MKGHKDTVPVDSQAWYLAEGGRGQQLLDQGRAGAAAEVFESMLTRIGETPSFARAVILGRLGRCFQAGGRPDIAAQHAREALHVLGELAPSDGVKGLRGRLRSELGDALRAAGQYAEARKAYEAALKIAEELHDLRGQGVDLGQLGALALLEGKLDEALARQQEALALFQRVGEPDMEAAARHQLGRICQRQSQWQDAERHYREAARLSEARGRLAAASHSAQSLAGLLIDRPDRLADARQLAEQALILAQRVDPAAADAWRVYGVLADIADKEAPLAADGEQRAAREAEARACRGLQRHAPIVAAALARTGETPGYGRAAILGQLARCFHIGRRPDLAAACASEAIGIAERLAPDEGAEALHVALHADLGDMLRAAGRAAEATQSYEAALTIAERRQDVLGQAHAAQRLGRPFVVPEPPQPHQSSAFAITLLDEVVTDYVIEPDLLVDGPRERRITGWSGNTTAPVSARRLMLPPCTRTWLDEQGAIRFGLPPGEPAVERHTGCTLMRRINRTVRVSGLSGLLWQLISELDGTRSAEEIISGQPAGDRQAAARLLAALAATGAADDSGRPVGRFIHAATKKGVLPAGGLEGDAVLHLATDGRYREYREAPRLDVSRDVPDRLQPFHALTRSRRSKRDYGGGALSRAAFDALLHTACGITGSMPWSGRDVPLRAYPSSGALYAVEIYPITFRVTDLAPAVYHYRAVEHVLEVVRPAIDLAAIAGAALPVERAMVAGAAALFCLAGSFARHERKYGEGGYRMLVAEAGHISQNLVLAATALGLAARPFGGVFDDLINHDLGLNGAEEQFLLAVLVGHDS